MQAKGITCSIYLIAAAVASLGLSTGTLAAGVSAEVASEAAPSLSVEYICDSGQTITVRYDNHDETGRTAILAIADREFELYQVVSASGARYATEQGLKPDMGLQWWVKGDVATLSEMIMDHTAPGPTVIDTCTAHPTE
jgi:membrane-bound inhibitor of C-type lysozyme